MEGNIIYPIWRDIVGHRDKEVEWQCLPLLEMSNCKCDEESKNIPFV